MNRRLVKRWTCRWCRKASVKEMYRHFNVRRRAHAGAEEQDRPATSTVTEAL